MNEKITVYFENDLCAEVIAVVYGDELYNKLLPTFEEYARELGGIITESIVPV